MAAVEILSKINEKPSAKSGEKYQPVAKAKLAAAASVWQYVEEISAAISNWLAASASAATYTK